jgi:hypothetical protein
MRIASALPHNPSTASPHRKLETLAASSLAAQ